MTTYEGVLQQKFNYSSTPNLASRNSMHTQNSKSKQNVLSQVLSFIKPSGRSMRSKIQLNSINEDAVHDTNIDWRTSNQGICETESEAKEIIDYKADIMSKYGNKNECKQLSRQGSLNMSLNNSQNYSSLNNLSGASGLAKNKHLSLNTVIF
jgi:hypothetical protein